MNTIPITFTLYYPTMAQVEAYLALMSMITIGFSVLRLATGYRCKNGTVFIFEMMLLINPVGASFPLIFDIYLKNGIGNLLYLAMYAAIPVLMFIPFLI